MGSSAPISRCAAVACGGRVYQGSYQFNEVFTGWWPQLVLANESGVSEREGVLLRIEPDGSMVYMEAVNAVVKSRMDLRRFPFDRSFLFISFVTMAAVFLVVL